MSTTLTRARIDDEVTEKEPGVLVRLAAEDLEPLDDESEEELMLWVYRRGGVELQDGASAGVS